MRDYISKIKEKISEYPQNYQVDSYKRITENDTYAPKSVYIKDIDRGTIEAFKTIYDIEANGKKIKFIPIMSVDKFNEYSKTWFPTNEDRYDELPLPLLLLIKEPLTKKGTIFGSKNNNIPAIKTFTNNRIPVLRNGKIQYINYSIPQPIIMDMHYTVHCFANDPRVLNKIVERTLSAFQANPYPVNVYEHTMYLYMENEKDSSSISELEKRKFYHIEYSFICKGYMLDAEQYGKFIEPSGVSISVHMDNDTPKANCNNGIVDVDCENCIEMKFTRVSEKSQSFRLKNNFEFQYDNLVRHSYYRYYVNNEEVTFPFRVKPNDVLTFVHNSNLKRSLNVRVCGEKL